MPHSFILFPKKCIKLGIRCCVNPGVVSRQSEGKIKFKCSVVSVSVELCTRYDGISELRFQEGIFSAKTHRT